MHLTGLSPFGPIFGKELRTASRRKRNYLLRVVYLGGLLLFLLWAYAITRMEYNAGVAGRAQQQEQLGWAFFMCFSCFTVGAMGLVGAVLTSTAINLERQAKTLHVLLMTPMTAWQIVSGKLLSRLLTALTLIGLSMPVLALVRLLGGVELQQMFGVICLCVVTAMISAALGLFFSILLQRAYAVILLSYFVMGVVYLFAPIMVMAYMAASSNRFGRLPWMMICNSYNPFFATGVLASGQMRIIAGNWVPCVLGHVAATIVLLILSALLLRRQTRREGEGAAAIGPILPSLAFDPDAPPMQLPAGPTGMAPLPPPRVRENRLVSDRPILWRELRRPFMTKGWQRAAGVVIGGALLVLAYGAAMVNDGLKEEGFHIAMSWVFYTILMLLAGVISATAIAQEKEGHTWEVLLASPLSGSAIVWGKALGVLRRLLWPGVLVAGHFLLFTIAGVIHPLALILVLVVMFCFNTVWIATGVALSLRFRKVTVAVIANLALPVVLYGAWSLILAVVDEVMMTHGKVIELVEWYMPWYYLGEGIDHMGSNSQGWRSGSCHLPGGEGVSISPESFVMVAIIVGAVHVAVACGILAWTAARLNAIVGRAPQLAALPPADTLRDFTRPIRPDAV